MATELVAIGASLGGLEALQKVLPALPATFCLPVAIVQHRRARTTDGVDLANLLSRGCHLPVAEPWDKEDIEPGHIYLAPANYHLLVERGRLALSVDPPVLYSRPSVDVLFESVADAYGAGGLAVVLTGASEDGAVGARAIKEAGGTVWVQDPATALSPISPRAAMARAMVDEVLPLDEIGERLAQLGAAKPAPTRWRPGPPSQKATPATGSSADNTTGSKVGKPA